MENWQIMDLLIAEGRVKVLAPATGYSEETLRYMAKERMSSEEPERSGRRSLLDRLEIIITVGGGYPAARPALRYLREKIDSWFRRVLDRDESPTIREMSDESLARSALAALDREVVRQNDEAICKNDYLKRDEPELARELGEAMLREASEETRAAELLIEVARRKLRIRTTLPAKALALR